jgi:hypothetical protein
VGNTVARRVAAIVSAIAVTGLVATAIASASASASIRIAPRMQMRTVNHASGLVPPPPNAHVSYLGGPVLQHVKVYGVIWGSGTFLPQMTGTPPTVSSFLTGITNSTYMDELSEYGANGQAIGHGSFAGMVNITPAPANDTAVLDDSQIQAELEQQVSDANLPAPDANTLYVLFFRQGQEITDNGFDSFHNFCAYHSTTATQHLVYAVMPLSASDTDPAQPMQGCGASPGLGNMTSVLSHEMTESITDPDVGLFTGFGPRLGRYDTTDGAEVSDLCNQWEKAVKLADGLKYIAQQNYSDQMHKCEITGPVRSFSVGDASVAEGNSGAQTLNIPVSLSETSRVPVTLHYTIAGSGANPATAGVDFDDGGGSGTVTFPMLSSSKSAVNEVISVPILPDTTVEPDETFQVTVTSAAATDPNGGYGFERAVGTGTILNDDPSSGVTVSVGDISTVVPQGKTKGLVNLPVTLSAVAGGEVDVPFTVSLGTATSKDVSTKSAGVLKIPAGSLSSNLVFKIKPHLDAGADKMITVTLGTPTGATLGGATGTFTLLRAT